MTQGGAVPVVCSCLFPDLTTGFSCPPPHPSTAQEHALSEQQSAPCTGCPRAVAESAQDQYLFENGRADYFYTFSIVGTEVHIHVSSVPAKSHEDQA